ncbi:MAG: ribonuclease Y [Chloroflexi bacterium]|jgi:ribonucrease Y|nr:ribonuclease Y [Chloroflexota bacterium]MBT3669320.1 ribonuclease Y [Chloroflexota bacterium]MBT4003481.1 ribonuclease Y [Chloroflexota bacterium]MBT4306027.1 ribonuclease Y [Chloroflexota bacterium]MBT4532671.1 ribonuclease Y [Chloroflexota bacterium]
MNDTIIYIIIGLVAISLGYLFRQLQLNALHKREGEKAERIIAEAKETAREVEVEAKNTSIQIRETAEDEIKRRRQDLSNEDDRLQRRRSEIDSQVDRLEKREQTLNKRQSTLDRKSNEVDDKQGEVLERLQQISTMTNDEAREVLLKEVEKEARSDMARIMRQIEAEAREDGEERARRLISLAIQRVASEHVSEITTSRVTLPSDEMKGRIIGRNGRNIRSFEQAAGVDVIVDDTPETVTISCFDPVRREIAKRTLQKLVNDGRIHPASIEKTLKKEGREVDKVMLEAGEQAVFDAGVPTLHREVIKVLGRLKFRTSYGQNQLDHAVETSKIASVIAAELGADVELAKMGGLLHDIGKAMDHDLEGTHAGIGGEFVARYGVPKKVVNAIESHHHEVEQETIEAVIVESADAISGARPGARRESIDQYIKRVKSLEEIANSFKGVNESFALQAGREVRIIVRPDDLDDLETTRLARDVAKQIEETMQYPGQIKVTVVRETRSIDYAK